jgi:hypothetical protein
MSCIKIIYVFELLTFKFALVNEETDSKSQDMGPHFVDGIGLLSVSLCPSAQSYPIFLGRTVHSFIHPSSGRAVCGGPSVEIVGSNGHGCLSVL